MDRSVAAAVVVASVLYVLTDGVTAILGACAALLAAVSLSSWLGKERPVHPGVMAGAVAIVAGLVLSRLASEAFTILGVMATFLVANVLCDNLLYWMGRSAEPASPLPDRASRSSITVPQAQKHADLSRADKCVAHLDSGDLAHAPIGDVDSSDSEWQRMLASQHDDQGLALTERGETAGAFVAFKAALGIRQMLARRGGNTESRGDLAISHHHIGDTLKALGGPAGALRSYQEALDIRRRLSEREPSSTRWLELTAACHNDIGGMLTLLGDTRMALGSYQASLDILQKLRSLEPSSVERLVGVADCHEMIGKTLLLRGDMRGALTRYHSALDIMEALAGLKPGNPGWQERVKCIRCIVGEMREAMDR
jgi:hypothetical protein